MVEKSRQNHGVDDVRVLGFLNSSHGEFLKGMGATETKAIQLLIEYDPSPIYNSGKASSASDDVIRVAEAKLAKDAKK